MLGICSSRCCFFSTIQMENQQQQHICMCYCACYIYADDGEDIHIENKRYGKIGDAKKSTVLLVLVFSGLWLQPNRSQSYSTAQHNTKKRFEATFMVLCMFSIGAWICKNTGDDRYASHLCVRQNISICMYFDFGKILLSLITTAIAMIIDILFCIYIIQT